MSDYTNGGFQPTNYNRLFNNKEFITRLLQNIRIKMGRQLVKTEMSYVINTLKNINPVIFKNKPVENIIKVLTESITEQIVKNPCKNNDDINIHEMLKSQIGVATDVDFNTDIKVEKDYTEQIVSAFTNQVEVVSLLGNKTILDLQRIINPGLVSRRASILLDTRYRILDGDGTTSFQWNFINNEIASQGTVNAIGNIRDIIAIRVFPIRIPYNSNADNEYNRISLFIQEFSAQSFIAHENRRFHFMFRPVVFDRWISLETADFNDGYYRFRNPITRIETLTLTFGSPLEQITFDTDRMNAYILDAGYSTITTFNTVSPHNLETGDTVIISNFSTLNNSTDNVFVSAINRTNGHIITYIDVDTFSIDVDSSSIVINGTGTISVTNGSPIVTGAGTTFGSFFFVGDSIEIAGVKYIIASIDSQTQLTLTTNYANTTAGGLTFKKNNIRTGLQVTAYYASKRIFIPMEIEYYETDDTKTN